MTCETQTSLLKQMHRTMVTIRLFEEKVADLILKKEIITPCHLYTGQEAVATGVCTGLNDDDLVFSTHRSHGHYIAKGGSIKSLMAEIFTKMTGCARGRGGSMHISVAKKGFPGSSAIVAGTIPLAVGAALAFQLQNKKSISVAFFGDGATNEGVFYESLNFASLKKLPIIFICENNLYSTHMPITDCLANPKIYQVAKTFNLPSVRIDGNDVMDIHNKVSEAIERARCDQGPSFFECMTYRWRGHVGPNYDIDKGLRSKDEVDYWINKCPIKRFEKYLSDRKLVSEPEFNSIYKDVENEIEEALNYARSSPYPDTSCEELKDAVFSQDRGGSCER